MGLFIISIMFGMMGFVFYSIHKDHFRGITTDSPTRLDDKNWIVNNEFVSLEEDTPLLRMKQKREDDRHYRDYEQRVLSYDRQIISDEWLKTKQFIVRHKGILEKVTETDLEQYAAWYNEYLFKCKKLNEDMFLTAEEFVVKEQNFMFIMSFNMFMPMGTAGAYIIHNEKTARYINGNMADMIKKEFKEKWY